MAIVKSGWELDFNGVNYFPRFQPAFQMSEAKVSSTIDNERPRHSVKERYEHVVPCAIGATIGTKLNSDTACDRLELHLLFLRIRNRVRCAFFFFFFWKITQVLQPCVNTTAETGEQKKKKTFVSSCPIRSIEWNIIQVFRDYKPRICDDDTDNDTKNKFNKANNEIDKKQFHDDFKQLVTIRRDTLFFFIKTCIKSIGIRHRIKVLSFRSIKKQ